MPPSPQFARPERCYCGSARLHRNQAGFVALSVQGLPTGVAATFSPATLSALQAGTITLGAAAPGTYSITITGEMKEAGALFTRTASATLTVLASANVTGVKGSFYVLRFKDRREWRFDAAPNATKIRIQGGCLFFLTEMRDAQGRFVKIQRS